MRTLVVSAVLSASLVVQALGATAGEPLRLYLRADGDCRQERVYSLATVAGTDERECAHDRLDGIDTGPVTIAGGDGRDVSFSTDLLPGSTLPNRIGGQIGIRHAGDIAAVLVIEPTAGTFTVTLDVIAHTADGPRPVGTVRHERPLAVQGNGYDLFPIDLDVPADLVGESVQALEAVVDVSGDYVNDGGIALNGRSYLDLG